MTYDSEHLADTPTAYWLLNEAAGPAIADSSGNGHSASSFGGVTFGTAGLDPTSADTAVTFDGTTGYIDAGDPGLWFAGDFTIDWLFKTTMTGEGFFLTKYDDSTPGEDNGIELIMINGQTWFAGRDGSGVYKQIYTARTYNDGATHHYAIARRGSVWELWMEGCLSVAVDQGSTGSMAVAENLYIGIVNDATLDTDFTPHYFYGGVLAKVAIYDGVALSPARIRKYADEAGMPPCFAPPLRLRQRDDALGPSTTPRLPRFQTSRQGSNRIRGYQ